MIFYLLGSILLSENTIELDGTIKYIQENQLLDKSQKSEEYLFSAENRTSVSEISKSMKRTDRSSYENSFESMNVVDLQNSSSTAKNKKITLIMHKNKKVKNNPVSHVSEEKKSTVVEDSTPRLTSTICSCEDINILVDYHLSMIDCVSYLDINTKYDKQFDNIVNEVFLLILKFQNTDCNTRDYAGDIDCKHPLHDLWLKIQDNFIRLNTQDEDSPQIDNMYKYILFKTFSMVSLSDIKESEGISLYPEILKEISNILDKYLGIPGIHSLPILIRTEKSHNVEQTFIYIFLKVISLIIDSLGGDSQKLNNEWSRKCNYIVSQSSYKDFKWKSKMIRRYKNDNSTTEGFNNYQLMENLRNKYLRTVQRKCYVSNVQIMICYKCISLILGKNLGLTNFLELKQKEQEYFEIISIISGIMFYNNRNHFEDRRTEKNHSNIGIHNLRYHLLDIYISLRILRLQKKVDKQENQDSSKLEQLKKKLKDEIFSLISYADLINSEHLYNECKMIFHSILLKR